MAQRMLIDATHPEETRVAVVSGNRLDDLDYETSTKKQLKGNIYLAKVVRVEPSLQACFVDYGGNRHGFLAFSEIHPDYYRIPIADREALLAEQAAAAAEEEAEEEREAEGFEGDAGAEPPSLEAADAPDAGAAGGETLESTPVTELGGYQPPLPEEAPAGGERAEERAPAASWTPAEWQIAEDEQRGSEPAPLVIPAIETSAAPGEPAPAEETNAADVVGADAGQSPDDGVIAPEGEPSENRPAPARRGVETVGGDAVDEVPRRRSRPMRNYKIQEVIKRRQIMLIQVVKEERGNKGAALTTYLSLAGRYCVLMPNTTRGGGVSRKITNATDRRRLKSLLDELNLPQGMAVIVRTAGSERSRAEVKRDCDYLLKLWDEIRELTLKSTAPSLIYEEASLIKRSIRDLYARDIDEILVEGEEGYRAAKDFMKMLMPSHAKRVQPYREPIPLFHRFQIESQIDAMHSPVVQLRSGGYVVINPTEALVAIDVNSGRATRERFIEETALRTNLEAAEEIARQLRLRDLGGLVVIDFIDMEDNRNNHAVERRLKEALRFDRARIQVGRISPFGLLELSRQRLRPSITETSTMPCPHCGGSGLIRSTESAALHVLRAIEEEGIRRRSREIVVHVATAVALYILNQKRAMLGEIERRYGLSVMVAEDATLIPPAYRLERVRAATGTEAAAPVRAESVLPPTEEEPLEAEAEVEEVVEEVEEEREAFAEAREEAGEEGGERRRRRRRRGRHRHRDGEDREGMRRERGPRREVAIEAQEAIQPMAAAAGRGMEEGVGLGEAEEEAQPADAAEAREAGGEPGAEGGERRRRRRGRRGGRRRGRREGAEQPLEGAVENAMDGEPRGSEAGFEEAGAEPRRAEEAPTPLHDDAPAWPRDPADEVQAAEAAMPRAGAESWPHARAAEAEPPPVESVVPAAPTAPAAPVSVVEPPPAPSAAPARSGPASSAPANVIVVDETTPKPASRRGWWQRLTQG